MIIPTFPEFNLESIQADPYTQENHNEMG